MPLKQSLVQISKRAVKYVNGFRHYLYYRFTEPKSKTAYHSEVHFDIQEFIYARYIYSLIKFFSLEGYRVTANPHPELLHNLSRAQYGKLVLKEHLVNLRANKGRGISIGEKGCDKKLVPSDFKPVTDDAVYDVPMAQHPMMYSKGYWDSAITVSGSRSRNILFIGNPDALLYSRLGNEGEFNVIDRAALWRMMLEGGVEVLSCGINDPGCTGHSGLILIDSGKSSVPMREFRQAIASHWFFLCAPGVFMPLCHNLIETLSVGVIPVIQRAYAEMMTPPLKNGYNAIIFENRDHLLVQLKSALSLNEKTLEEMGRNCLDYYNEHLTPGAVVAKILNPRTKVVRVLAGEHSLRLKKYGTY